MKIGNLKSHVSDGNCTFTVENIKEVKGFNDISSNKKREAILKKQRKMIRLSREVDRDCLDLVFKHSAKTFN